jgi:hypothetical protein
MSNRSWHYVKENRANRIPRHHVFVDAEAMSTREGRRETQRFRLAVACFHAQPKGRKAKERWQRFTDPTALWSAVSDFCGPRHRTVVWAHNLGYDVRVGEALVTLPRLGWRLVAHNMANRGTWLCWSRGDSSLVMVDSSSVFPTTLAQVGKTLGMGKPELPSTLDTDAEWFARCEADVAILRASVLAYLRWLEREDLGNWQWTGAGQSWAAFRHRFMTHKMLVHADIDALAAERRAMWTGRCEAYWHGSMLREVLHEWDMATAYARVAQATDVPVRLSGPMPATADYRRYLDRRGLALLARCTVNTPAPVVPAERNGRILWPIGEFETTLWDVEIRAALDAGATVTVHRGWLYRTAPALREWASWVLAMLDAPDNVCSALEKTVVKHWSRALIGRLAMTHTSWAQYGRLPTVDTRRWTCVDRDTMSTVDMLQVGTEIFEQEGVDEWDESMPMVTGYIQAVCRVWLWNIIQALPPRSIVYVDTDSVFTTDHHYSDFARVAADLSGYGLRLKRSWDGFTITGPRQIVTGDRVRVAGLPTRARRTGRDTFTGEVWESLTKAMKEGRFREVRVEARDWQLRGVDRRRVSKGLGWTAPVAVEHPGSP